MGIAKRVMKLTHLAMLSVYDAKIVTLHVRISN